MQIDAQHSPRASDSNGHEHGDTRAGRSPRDLAHSLAEHLSTHAADGGHTRLMESIARYMDNNADRYGTSGQFGRSWLDTAGTAAAPQILSESHLSLVLEDILEELNGGTGPGSEGEDAFSNEDLLQDLIEMFARRRRPIGENQIGNQGDFGSADNPFAGALFTSWGNELQGTTTLRDEAGELLLLLQLVSILGREKLDALLEIDSDRGKAHYRDEDADLLFEVARFMDQHPALFGTAVGSDGRPSTWTERIASGRPLDTEESGMFRQALERLDLELRRLAGQAPFVPARLRNRRSRDDIEFDLNAAGTARNLLHLMYA